MSITALSGPIVQFGTVTTSTAGTGLYGADAEHNPQRGPMVTDLGDAMMDPRVAYDYNPGSNPGSYSGKVFGFFNNVGMVDYVPTTASTQAFVAQTAATSGQTTFTLQAASSARGTYATTIIAPETNKTSENLLAIDSTAAYLTFGSDGTVAVWNPAAGAGRLVSITTSSSGDVGSFTIAGRDLYGYKITEQLVITDGTSQSSGYLIFSRKGYKYISSITNASAPTSTNATIGIADRFELPLYAQYMGLNCQIAVNTSANNSVLSVLSTANIVLASTAATQTSTTPDVRGIYISSVASNNVVRLQMMVSPTAVSMASITSTNVQPLFGGNQFSSI